MNRLLVAGFLASAVAVSLGACGDDSDTPYAYGYAGGGSTATTCSSYTTCGTCTPVEGCGWCFNGSTGACTSDPDSCPLDASEFTWTWNQSGCPWTADAGVVPTDAAPASQEAGPAEAATPAEASVADAPAGE
jgi:hypothetical protein